MFKSFKARAAGAASIAALGFAAAAPAYAQVDDIFVTATKREQAIQDIPLAVSAFSPEALENSGIEDVRDLQQLSPSFTFGTGQSNSTGSVASIRGIGTGGDNPGFESAVGFFIDGVYRSRAGTALADLPEIERIEILRGPQGTLFGRNTSSGAISVLTARPEFETRAFADATYGNYDNLEFTAGVTGPVVADILALRLEGGIRQRDGYIEDVNTGRDINTRDRWFVRGQAAWNISPTADLRLIIDAAESDEECCAALTFLAPTAGDGSNFTGTVQGIAALQGLTGLVIPPNPEDYKTAISPNRNYDEATEDFGISGELNWEIPWGTLTSITAYRDFEATRNQDIDFSGIDRAHRTDYGNGFETFSQELRLQGEWSRVNWLVGAFFVDEKATLTDTVRYGADAAAYVDRVINGLSGGTLQVFGTGAGNSVLALGNPVLFGTFLIDPIAGEGLNNDEFETDTQSFALFTHNVFSITEALDLTIGLRYNYETKDVTAELNSISPACEQLNGNALVDPLAPTIQAAAQTAILNPDPDLAKLAGAAFLLACNPAINTQGNGSYEDDSEENEFTGTANLSYQFTPDLLGYASYSRGYKAGGYNLDRSSFFYNTLSPLLPAPAIEQLAFDPEFVDAYEVGAKFGIWNGLGTLNIAAYWQEIEDYQLNAFSGFNFVTFNVEQAVSRGVEVEAALQPTDNLTLSAGVTYNEAYYDSDVVLPGSAAVAIAQGTQFAGAPEWTLTGSATYTQPIPNTGLEALFYLDGRWRNEAPTQTLGRDPATDQDAFAIINARIGIGPENKAWSVEVWSRNLFDEFARGAFNVPEQGAGVGANIVAVYPNEPRTYGLTLRANF